MYTALRGWCLIRVTASWWTPQCWTCWRILAWHGHPHLIDGRYSTNITEVRHPCLSLSLRILQSWRAGKSCGPTGCGERWAPLQSRPRWRGVRVSARLIGTWTWKMVEVHSATGNEKTSYFNSLHLMPKFANNLSEPHTALPVHLSVAYSPTQPILPNV